MLLNGLACDELAGAQLHARKPVVPDIESRDLAVDDGDATSGQLLGLLPGQDGSGVLKQHHVDAPPAESESEISVDDCSRRDDR